MKSQTTQTLQGKRIIFVVADLVMGGAERQALQLAQKLKHEKGALVQFWGLGNNVGIIPDICESQGIPWRQIPVAPWYRGRMGKVKILVTLVTQLRKARPDVLLPYLITSNVACGLVWRWTGARVCIWNQRDAGVERIGMRTERAAIRNTPWFVSNSEGGAELLSSAFGDPPDRIRVILND